jgi:hypothetical protein
VWPAGTVEAIARCTSGMTKVVGQPRVAGSPNKVNLPVTFRAAFDPVRVEFRCFRELDPRPFTVDQDLAAGLGKIEIVKISSDGVTPK